MKYYLIVITIHTLAAIWLTRKRRTPRRFTPGHIQPSKLDGNHKTYWIPMS